MYPKSKAPQLISIILIFVGFVLFAFLTAPEPKDVGQEEFIAYNLITSEEKLFQLEMTVYPNNSTPLGKTLYNVKATYDNEDFYYDGELNPEREEAYLPLTNGDKLLGVLLPDEDFEEMILIFSEDKHYSKDESLYYTSFPQMDVQRTTRPLTELLEKYDYDLTERPTN